MERREGMQPQYIQIEGPVMLEQGQNFYDQPPFNVIVPRVAEQHGVQTDILLRGVTNVAKKVGNLTASNKDQAMSYYSNYGRGASDVFKTLSNHEGKILKLEEARSYGPALQDVLNALKIFPEWTTYIKTKMVSGHYRVDGSIDERDNSANYKPPVPSYLKWYENKMTREGNIQSAAIKSVTVDAFPVQHDYRSIQEASKQHIRRWFIRKASGIHNPNR